MIYIDVPPEQWALKLGLELRPDMSECGNCGGVRVMRSYRTRTASGIEYRCPCGGNSSLGSIAIITCPEENAIWRSLIGHPND